MFPLRTSIPIRFPAIAVGSLIAVNAVVFYFELSLRPDLVEPFIQAFGLVPARITAGSPLAVHKYWPVFTSMFLHGGWLHIIGNMWFLWIFGANVEDRMGHFRFLAFYFICGIAAAALQCLTNLGSTLPTVGASGAISGVMGAYFALFPTSRLLVMVPVFIFPFFFELPAVLYLAFWFLLQLFSGTIALSEASAQVGGVAFWAHVGGFATGIVLTPVFVRGQAAYRGWHPDEHAGSHL